MVPRNDVLGLAEVALHVGHRKVLWLLDAEFVGHNVESKHLNELSILCWKFDMTTIRPPEKEGKDIWVIVRQCDFACRGLSEPPIECLLEEWDAVGNDGLVGMVS